MRGRSGPQQPMFHYYHVDDRIPADRALRRIKAQADAALRELGPVFAARQSERGRPSIPPETLLKSQLLIALYSVRSDRLFCEQLAYNLLYRWFLDLDPEAPAFDPSTFCKNREQLLPQDVARRFFDAVVRQARTAGLLSDEHFSVDGTLIEAWASLNSFKRKTDGAGDPASDDPGNPTVDFHGEHRSNRTHQSTTDPEARLLRHGKGREAKHFFAGHVLMENRHGLCVDLAVTAATGTAERADKGHHTRAFIRQLRARGIRPHVRPITGHRTPGLDGPTLRHQSFAVSQRCRQRVEEVFGGRRPPGACARRASAASRARSCTRSWSAPRTICCA